jgi:hypothetical protein
VALMMGKPAALGGNNMQAISGFRISPVRDMIRRTATRPRLRTRLRVVTMPKTFNQALSRGWKIVREQTHLEADKRHRYGTVVLRLAGQPRQLSVAYTASIVNGYDFGKPQLI